MRVIRGAWSDETAHARGKQSGRSLVEAKADCVTERVTDGVCPRCGGKGNTNSFS